MSLIYDFFTTLRSSVRSIKDLPQKIDSIIYDPRFTPNRVIDEIVRSDIPPVDIPGFYSHIFDELDSLVEFNALPYVTCSSDLMEGPEVGDYDYHAGRIGGDIAVLYMQSSWLLPSRAILYGNDVQIEFTNHKIPVEIIPVNHRIREKIIIEDHISRAAEVKCWLMTCDRPTLDEDE